MGEPQVASGRQPAVDVAAQQQKAREEKKVREKMDAELLQEAEAEEEEKEVVELDADLSELFSEDDAPVKKQVRVCCVCGGSLSSHSVCVRDRRQFCEATRGR